MGESILTFLSLLIYTAKLLPKKDILLYMPSLMHALYCMLLSVYSKSLVKDICMFSVI